MPSVRDGSLTIYGKAITKRIVVIGTYVELRCNPGFKLIEGQNYAACTSESRFLQPKLGRCTNQCIEMVQIPNGRVRNLPRTIDTILGIVCDDGYRLEGRERVYCLGNGTFTEPGKCVPWNQQQQQPVENTTVVDLDAPIDPWLISNVTFHEAAYLGEISRIFDFLNFGTDPDQRDQFNSTPLMSAASNGNSYISKLLLDKGADPNAVDDNGNFAIMWAARRNFVDTIQLLVNRGANVNAGKQFTALTIAAENNQTDAGQLLVVLGADVNSQVLFGNSSLTFYTINDNALMARYLLEHRADVEYRGPNGMTALMEASKLGLVGPARVLLNFGANVNSTDHDGVTPLMWAAISRRRDQQLLDTASLLIRRRAHIDKMTINGTTALMMAAIAGNPQMTRLLLDYEADPMLESIAGDTALSLARRYGHEDVARLLYNYSLSFLALFL